MAGWEPWACITSKGLSLVMGILPAKPQLLNIPQALTKDPTTSSCGPRVQNISGGSCFRFIQWHSFILLFLNLRSIKISIYLSFSTIPWDWQWKKMWVQGRMTHQLMQLTNQMPDAELIRRHKSEKKKKQKPNKQKPQTNKQTNEKTPLSLCL